MMHAVYRTLPPKRLLASLEKAGRYPDPELIQACRERRQEITSGLLDMLSAGIDERWAEDDPRWYREIHAGLLLIEFREAAALPLFEDILRDEERAAELGEWFETQLPAYGPVITPMLIELASDERVPRGGRIAAIEMLGRVGQLHQAEQVRILPALRALLPALGDDGTLTLPAQPEHIDYEDVEIWTWVISSLTDLQDVVSRPQVVALFMEDLVDETVVGDVNLYMEELATAERPAPDVVQPPDIQTFYEDVATFDNMDEEEVLDLYRGALLQAGIDDEAMEGILLDLEERLTSEHDHLDALFEGYLIEEMRRVLQEVGVAQDKLDETVEGLLFHMFGANEARRRERDEEEDDDLAEPPSSGLA